MLPSGSGVDLYEQWFLFVETIQQIDIDSVRVICCSEPSPVVLSSARHYDFPGMIVGDSPSCSSSSLCQATAPCAPSVAYRPSEGPAAAGKRLINAERTVRPPKKRTDVFGSNGQRLDSCLRTSTPLPKLSVHWGDEGNSALSECITVQVQAIPAEGEGRPVPSLTRKTVVDAVWHPSRSRSKLFAQAIAQRDAWELAHLFKTLVSQRLASAHRLKR